MQELRQEVKLQQQLAMTPQLQQSIKLLQLSRMELIEMVQEELLQNPVLEESQKQESPEDEPAPTQASTEDEKGDMLNEIPDDYLSQYAHDSYSA